MIHKELYKNILVDPAKSGADQLYIVSGYATPAMVYRHLLEKQTNDFKINLIIGMAGAEGIARPYHQAYKDISTRDYAGRFDCFYFSKMPPVHTKAYAWYRNSEPIIGFIGSANYTQTGFSDSRQREAMEEADASEVLDYFKNLLAGSMHCLDSKVERAVSFVEIERRRTKVKSQPTIVAAPRLAPVIVGDDTPEARVSLLAQGGIVGKTSGLNWGQRAGRTGNETYIRISSDVYRRKFFPPIGKHFTIVTDDGQTFDAVTAQQEGKAIHTPFNNSFLGIYFRDRLGVPHGGRVTRSDLEKYGRTTVDFSKIDAETYYMDFSV